MPFRDRVVAITRPEGRAEELAAMVAKLGWKPYIAPTVEIHPLKDNGPLRRFIHNVIAGEVDCVVFLSRNGVLATVRASERLKLRNEFIEALNRKLIVAIGPKTRRELGDHAVNMNLTPADHSSEGIVENLREIDLQGKIVAIPRMNKPNHYLRQRLEGMGATVQEVPAYKSSIPADISKVLNLLKDLVKGRIDVVTFTSSGAAKNFFKVAIENGLDSSLRRCLNEEMTVAAIGEATRKTLEGFGIKVDVVPTEPTVEGMVEALMRYLNRR